MEHVRLKFKRDTFFKLFIIAYKEAICPISLLMVNSRLLARSSLQMASSGNKQYENPFSFNYWGKSQEN